MAKTFSRMEFIHFNDVYNVGSRTKEPVGGAARFVNRINEIRREATENGQPEPLVVFSGDAFNPSIMSTITKGKQMIPVLNAARVAVAVYGNHDFDFGVENLEILAGQCDFPWLMSNVVSKETHDKLAHGKETVVLEVAGRKVGFVGVVEREWLETLATLDVADVEYEDYCVCARRLAAELRAAGCEMVVALSHMRVPNDVRLATECGDVIDLVLGGHDHHYAVKQYGEHGTYVCKSGTDFRQMTVLEVDFAAGRPRVDKWRCENITVDVAEEPALKDELSGYMDLVSARMNSVVGSTCVPLDCRFSRVRTQETNMANFVADMLRRATDADVALLNSGTLRTDAVVDAGSLLMKDLVNLLPMMDQTVVVRVGGAQLLAALENGVSQYPRLEGRFPCVSGVRFVFDAARPAGERVVAGSVTVDGAPLDVASGSYTVATKSYLAHGKDGYDALREHEVVLDDETAPLLPTLLRNTFAELEVLDSMAPVARRKRRSVLRGVEKWKKLAHVDDEAPPVKTCDGCSAFGIRPVVDGRITCLNPVDIS